MNQALQSPLQKVTLVECPRDAMQGWPHPIATAQKVAYLNQLLQVGFDTIDAGSFVSPKAIPQMADTAAVFRQLNLGSTTSKILAIVANVRGATEAVTFDEISYLGFPFSVSPTFQLRNTNSTIEDSLERVNEIQNLCVKNGKQLVVYISMGFGNPYGDPYNEAVVMGWIDQLIAMDINIISLADTVGVATPDQVGNMLSALIPQYTDTSFGVHLHATAADWEPKVAAALKAGCSRFDGALKGIGGCPMAGNDLVGNMDTEKMIPYFESLNLLPPLNAVALEQSIQLANHIFI